MINNQTIFYFLWLIISGDGDARFAFNILPAIALTTLFSLVAILTSKAIEAKSYWLSIIPIIVLWIFENTIGAKYISIRLLLIGLYGCLIGKGLSYIKWNKFLKMLNDKKIIIYLITIVIIYFASIYYRFWPSGNILLWRHTIPTSLFIALTYMTSYSLNLSQNKWALFFNNIFGKYLLFIYILHIGIIKFFCFTLKGYEGNLTFMNTVIMSFF